MNPVVVIATHRRISVTAANIKSLIPYTVVVVVSDPQEGFFLSKMSNAKVIIAPNDPLGAKWQAGVDFARTIPHTHIVITGSDDILAGGFIQTAVYKQTDFIGLRAWYVWHENKIYHLRYVAPDELPLGGGRVYSKEFLQKYDYQIFDKGRKKLLDDLGWEIAKKGNYSLVYSPKILAIKGHWPVMNPLDLRHKNVRLLKIFSGEETKEVLNQFDIDAESISTGNR